MKINVVGPVPTAEVPGETQLARVEETRQDALEVAQEADATPEARAEDAAAVITRCAASRAGENYIRGWRFRRLTGT
jgi:hypothetical protein